MNINVYIERVVFDGLDLPAAQRPELQAALEAELTRLLAEGGLAPALAQGARLPVLRLGELPLALGALPASPDAIPASAPSHAAEIGRQIAGAVYRGIGE